MMEAMITQIEEQQNIMTELLQEIQEKDEKLTCFQEQEERLEENKRIIAERERENARCRNHDRGMSR